MVVVKMYKGGIDGQKLKSPEVYSIYSMMGTGTPTIICTKRPWSSAASTGCLASQSQ